MPSFISIPINGISTDSKPRNTKTYELDFENHRMLSRKIDGIDAVNQFIEKALRTPRFKCLIYSSAYGSEVKKLIASSPSRAYLEASIYNIFEDAIIHDDRIIAVPQEEFSFSFDGDGMYINAVVQTVYGETQIKEVYSGV